MGRTKEDRSEIPVPREKEMTSKVAVIVAAAGASTRFGGPVKKTFAKIGERAVIIRTLELFINRDDVCEIVLAVSEDDYDMVKTKFGANLGFMGVKLVKGGDKRWLTVRNALAALSSEAKLVAIHDGARPCLAAETITQVFEAAEKTGAAILAAPVNATVKRIDEKNTIETTVDRNRLYLAQTPQVFKRELLLDAYQRITDTHVDFTDDAQVLEQAGMKVTIVESEQTNIKITTQNDLKLAEVILAILPKPKKVGPTGPWAAEQGW
jgi:2-C-methyl-D-erythritol 4-phosphate cytidylyltransferase